MVKEKKSLGESLVEEGIITPDQLKQAQEGKNNLTYFCRRPKIPYLSYFTKKLTLHILKKGRDCVLFIKRY